MKLIGILLYIFCIALYSNIVKSADNSTIIAVHILFRHGDRTPTRKAVYKTDPYINDSYDPYGPGELTNAGKNTQYNLGVRLRKRYKKILGDIYKPNMVFAFSTHVKRTQTSLQCVLAGLFPPEGPLDWREDVKWQPIPYNVQNNEVQLLSAHTCSDVKKHILDFRQNDTNYKTFIGQYKWLFEYLNEKAGGPFNDAYDVYKLYCTLLQQQSFGYNLPEWTNAVFKNPMEKVAVHNYYHYCGNDMLKMMNSGSLLRKILLDSKYKICGHLSPQEAKIFLYSGHQVNVACFLNTLGVFTEHLPHFGAHVTIELVEINKVYGFKVLYQNREADNLQVLKIPNCEEFCPFTMFVQIMQPFLPNQTICSNWSTAY